MSLWACPNSHGLFPFREDMRCPTCGWSERLDPVNRARMETTEKCQKPPRRKRTAREGQEGGR